MSNENITLDDAKDLVTLYSQALFPTTPEGFRKWATSLHRQKVISSTDVLLLEKWFRDGFLLFQGMTYERVRG